MTKNTLFAYLIQKYPKNTILKVYKLLKIHEFLRFLQNYDV